jgi:hypothetical protein
MFPTHGQGGFGYDTPTEILDKASKLGYNDHKNPPSGLPERRSICGPGPRKRTDRAAHWASAAGTHELEAQTSGKSSSLVNTRIGSEASAQSS